MKKFYWILTVCLVFYFNSCFAETEVLIEVNEAHPPFIYAENNEIKGIYKYMIDEVNKELAGDYKIKLQAKPWIRVKKNIEYGLAFGLVAVLTNNILSCNITCYENDKNWQSSRNFRCVYSNIA